MAHALELGQSDPALASHAKLSFRDGAYSYVIERRTFTVSDGAGAVAVPIKWAFGANSQTYVLEYQGKLYESRVSYYPNIDALDLTMGDQDTHPRTLVEAMGRELSNGEARACFGCHATNAVANDQVRLDALTPGVQCAHCHAGADAHRQAIAQGKVGSIPAKLSRLSAEDMANFCGQCHRSFAEVVRNRLFGPVNVRFQPYRLTESKCFNGSDKRISCVACHDPHVEVVGEETSYDPKCQACHGVDAPVCRVAKSQCASCHMPKVDLAGAHQTFTDHYIRVVRKGEGYPE